MTRGRYNTRAFHLRPRGPPPSSRPPRARLQNVIVLPAPNPAEPAGQQRAFAQGSREPVIIEEVTEENGLGAAGVPRNVQQENIRDASDHGTDAESDREADADEGAGGGLGGRRAADERQNIILENNYARNNAPGNKNFIRNKNWKKKQNIQYTVKNLQKTINKMKKEEESRKKQERFEQSVQKIVNKNLYPSLGASMFPSTAQFLSPPAAVSYGYGHQPPVNYSLPPPNYTPFQPQSYYAGPLSQSQQQQNSAAYAAMMHLYGQNSMSLPNHHFGPY